jgi:hypothetical protein
LDQPGGLCRVSQAGQVADESLTELGLSGHRYIYAACGAGMVIALLLCRQAPGQWR